MLLSCEALVHWNGNPPVFQKKKRLAQKSYFMIFWASPIDGWSQPVFPPKKAGWELLYDYLCAQTLRTTFVWLRSGPTEKIDNGMPVSWETRSK